MYVDLSTAVPRSVKRSLLNVSEMETFTGKYPAYHFHRLSTSLTIRGVVIDSLI